MSTNVSLHTFYCIFFLACATVVECNAQDSACNDRYPSHICNEYTRRGLCRFVQKNCKQTCGLCNTSSEAVVKAIWSKWSSFGECTVSCGYGVQYRNRNCSKENSCAGRPVSARLCFEGDCQAATWNSWGPFSSCSVTCGRGIQSMRRSCRMPGRCFGVNIAVKPCEEKPCSEWGEWGKYGACSLSCGPGGLQVRSRSCLGAGDCNGPPKSSRTCLNGRCVVGHWTKWGPFSRCTVSCGRGTRTRFRSCRGAKVCKGSNKSVWMCNKAPCLPDDGWSNCTRSCGAGSKYRFDDAQCTDVNNPKCLRSFQECNAKPCEPDVCGMNQFKRYNGTACCMVNKDTSCGFSFVSGRIIGGAVAKNRQWPWMVSVNVRGVLCGATLISRHWIVTAGHCVKKNGKLSKPGDLTVRLGSNYLYSNSRSVLHEVQKIILHPLYNNLKNDIALLKLKTRVDFGPDAQPLCLPRGETPPIDSTCFALGWGLTEPHPTQPVASSRLIEVGLKNLDINVCRRVYGTNKEVGEYVRNSDRLLCAGSLTKRKDICRGDSGGPLLCQRRNSCAWYLAGVISFGPKGTCGEVGFPGMYTKIAAFEKWITRHIPDLMKQHSC